MAWVSGHTSSIFLSAAWSAGVLISGTVAGGFLSSVAGGGGGGGGGGAETGATAGCPIGRWSRAICGLSETVGCATSSRALSE